MTIFALCIRNFNTFSRTIVNFTNKISIPAESQYSKTWHSKCLTPVAQWPESIRHESEHYGGGGGSSSPHHPPPAHHPPPPAQHPPPPPITYRLEYFLSQEYFDTFLRTFESKINIVAHTQLTLQISTLQTKLCYLGPLGDPQLS